MKSGILCLSSDLIWKRFNQDRSHRARDVRCVDRCSLLAIRRNVQGRWNRRKDLFPMFFVRPFECLVVSVFCDFKIKMCSMDLEDSSFLFGHLKKIWVTLLLHCVSVGSVTWSVEREQKVEILLDRFGCRRIA